MVALVEAYMRKGGIQTRRLADPGSERCLQGETEKIFELFPCLTGPFITTVDVDRSEQDLSCALALNKISNSYRHPLEKTYFALKHRMEDKAILTIYTFRPVIW